MRNQDLFACGLMNVERLSNEMTRLYFYVERPMEKLVSFCGKLFRTWSVVA
jgi:hypothetical protein